MSRPASPCLRVSTARYGMMGWNTSPGVAPTWARASPPGSSVAAVAPTTPAAVNPPMRRSAARRSTVFSSISSMRSPSRSQRMNRCTVQHAPWAAGRSATSPHPLTSPAAHSVADATSTTCGWRSMTSTPAARRQLEAGSQVGAHADVLQDLTRAVGLEEQQCRFPTHLAEHRALRVAAHVPRLDRPDQAARLGLEDAVVRAVERGQLVAVDVVDDEHVRLLARERLTEGGELLDEPEHRVGLGPRRADRDRRCRRPGPRSTPRTPTRSASGPRGAAPSSVPSAGGPVTHSPL